MKTLRLPILTTLVLFWASTALAHPGHTEAANFQAGFTHPLSGLDHMLAMVAVGLWAAVRGGRAVWAWPLAFVAAMLAGGALGLAGVHLPLIQPVILASVIVLGLMIAAAVRAPLLAGAALVAVFGLAHGYAHGAEAPASAGLTFTLTYAFGFALMTAGLHLAGVASGLGLARFRRPVVARLLGAATALGGLMMVLS